MRRLLCWLLGCDIVTVYERPHHIKDKGVYRGVCVHCGRERWRVER